MERGAAPRRRGRREGERGSAGRGGGDGAAMIEGDTPVPHRALITVCAMAATLMQALDSTIANVALPYCCGPH